MRQLQGKEVSVGAGTVKNAIVTTYFVHKKPIRFYMQLPVRFPLAFEGMITTLLGQRFLIKQKQDYCLQLLPIVAAMFHLFQITTKLSGKSGITHSDTQLPKEVIRILGVKYFLSPFRFLYGFAGQRIGNIISERQTLFMSDPGQHHAADVGNSQPHSRKHRRGLVLDYRINPGTDIIVGRHSYSPCLQYCSSIEQQVNPAINGGKGGRHGL